MLRPQQGVEGEEGEALEEQNFASTPFSAIFSTLVHLLFVEAPRPFVAALLLFLLLPWMKG